MIYSFCKASVWPFLAFTLAVVLLFSFYSPRGTFVATPKFWRDEAIPFEIARTFLELGKLDVVVSPGVVDGRPYLTNATGFPATVPLAGFFYLFGIGVLQARLFMVVWIVATVLLLFFVLKSFFSFPPAALGTLLVATFSSFYANGRTFTGEVPGFFFLILALFYLFKKENYIWGGFFLALAAVTKPSVYLLVFPALFLEFLFFERRNLVSRGLRVFAGALPVILLWLWIIVPHWFLGSNWRGLFDLYAHPFNEPSLFSRFPEALPRLLVHSTIFYFGGLSALVFFGLKKEAYRGPARRLVLFALFYGVWSVIYFVRSPGWFRYLLVYELLVLGCLYPALELFAKRIKVPSVVFMLALLMLQGSNFFFFSNIPSGTDSILLADFINKKLLADSNATIGFINMPTVAPLIAPYRKYQVGEIGGKEHYGTNPLARAPSELPTYLVGYDEKSSEFREIFLHYYTPSDTRPPGKYILYKKREF